MIMEEYKYALYVLFFTNMLFGFMMISPATNINEGLASWYFIITSILAMVYTFKLGRKKQGGK